MARHDLSRPIWGKRLQDIREDREQSQTQVADGLNKILGEDSKIKRQTIEHWESGTHYLRSGDLKALADYFGCSPDYFFGITDSTSTDAKLRFICDHTGLSDDAIKVLNQEKDDLLIGFLNSFLTSDAWKEIIADIAAALESNGIAQKTECNTDVRRAATLAHIKADKGDDGYQYDGLPEIPPGTVLLTAKQGTDYYIENATRLFGEYLRNKFVNSYGGSGNNGK